MDSWAAPLNIPGLISEQKRGLSQALINNNVKRLSNLVTEKRSFETLNYKKPFKLKIFPSALTKIYGWKS